MLQKIGGTNSWELISRELWYNTPKFKLFSQKEKDLSLKIEKLTYYMRSEPFRGKFKDFLKELKSFGVIESSYKMKTGIYNKLEKKKQGKGIVYFEDTCSGENGFRFLKVNESDFEKLEIFCEDYLIYILGFGKKTMEEAVAKSQEEFTKILLEITF